MTKTNLEILREETSETHNRLDKAIMERKPFADTTRYGGFVQMQHLLHQAMRPLYSRADLAAVIPELETLGRAGATEADLADLALPTPEPSLSAPDFAAMPLPKALGALYVIEGSNLGAAFLLKAAKALGLSETHGARHLAGAPEGRARHWATFTTALNTLELDEAGKADLAEGARTAFDYTHKLAMHHIAA